MADQIAAELSQSPEAFTEVIAGLKSRDGLLRMRCADVAEKVSKNKPEWLMPHKTFLLELAGSSSQQELRWHLAQMLPRLKLNVAERERALNILLDDLDCQSSVVKTFALQGLFDLAELDECLRPQIKSLLEKSAKTGTPAMKARVRKLQNRVQAW